MKEYLDVLQKILNEGVEKESGRANMPNTIGISKADISMDLSEGFPLLTTKRMFWKGIVHELLWFLRGDTNIKYLVDNKVNIWNGDAYRWYLKKCNENNILETNSMEEFISYIHNTDKLDAVWIPNYKYGDLGKVYGAQWRNQNGVDQVQEVMDGLKKNPYSRYHIIDGWNKTDFPEMALPPCHLLYQFIVRPLSGEERVKLYNKKDGLKRMLGQFEYPEDYISIDDEDIPEPIGWSLSDEDKKDLDDNNIPKFYLDLNMYQRSCDTFLGVPFNIASMSLLLTIMAKANNMLAGVANWIGGDTHMYVSHLDAVNEQLSRTPTKLPQVQINKDIETLEDICALTIDDIKFVNYEYQDSIKAELFTGLKKK